MLWAFRPFKTGEVMEDNSNVYPETLKDEEQAERTGRPAVSYPTSAPAADPQRVYEPVPPSDKEEETGSGVGRTIYKIVRAVLYLAYIGWSVLTCIRLWTELPGKGILQHVTQYATMLLAPAIIIDLILRIIRRIVYGKKARRLMRERWALTGLILTLALVFVVWMLLWKYVVKDLAGL